MNAQTAYAGGETLPARPAPAFRFWRETGLLVARGIRMIPRVPERLSDVTIQPVMFTLLFLYVFGSAIKIPGMSYQDFLLPGIIAQSVGFGVIGAATATATDFASGVIDRFRSLPVVRMSVLTAQVIGQVLEQIIGISIVIAIGLICGWSPEVGIGGALQMAGLILIGLFSFTIVGTTLGMAVRSADAAQGIGFAIVLPLTFMAGTFVPIETMKAIPKWIGEHNPVSAFVAAIRQVSQGTQAHGSWQLEHPVPAMLIWCAIAVIVCLPIALHKFKNSD
ncbi:MAG: ABC transporter permease [Solirubrobacterales bacterium]